MTNQEAPKTRKAKFDFAALYGALGVMVVALVLAEIAVFFIYSWLEPDAMPRRMAVTGVVTVLVSFPIGYYIHQQNARLRQLTEELKYIASIDQMSGLMNRTSFLAAVQTSIDETFSEDDAGSFLFIDADHFKSLNDHFGHSTGDEAIKQIGGIVKDITPENSFAGRIGGEEFGVYLPKTDIWSATSIAESIRRRVRLLIFEDAVHSHKLSISVGIAKYLVGQSLSEFVQIADERMYVAKATGRNKIVFEDQPKTPTEHRESA